MRIAFDLDNTLIPNAFDFETELPNRKWMAKLFRYEPLRLGTKALFDACHAKGYETWIYTSSLRSTFYIRKLFWLYDIKLHGIINQMIHDAVVKVGSSKYPPHFGIDYLIDDSKGVQMEGKQYGFKVILVDPSDCCWEKRILNSLLS
ncbi:MAG: hypothetical protein RL329_2624 [Bacteroidota bacterium]